jgi:hypothetical protein
VYNIIRADGLWVAATDKGLYYSEDGIQWVLSNITSSIQNLVNGKGMWLASNHSNDNTSVGYYSQNGKEWIQIDSVPFMQSIVYGDGIWVARTDTYLSYSTDGIVFTQCNCDPITSSYPELLYSDGTWVLDNGTGKVYCSTDGIAWNLCLSTSRYNELRLVNHVWFLISGSSGSGLYYSYDGVTWQQIPFWGEREYVDSVHYFNGLWFINKERNTTDENGLFSSLYYSANLSDWTKCSFDAKFNAYGTKIAYADGLLVLGTGVMGSDYLFYSTVWEP